MPHILQFAFDAKTRSPQPAQIQSPGFMDMRRDCDPSTPHLWHVLRREKLRLLQPGQTQSPGFAPTLGAGPAAVPLGVPHILHASLDAKTRSPQFGQIQSPNLPPGGTGPFPPLPAMACIMVIIMAIPPIPGFGFPHILQANLDAKTRSPQLGHDQSPGFPPGGVGPLPPLPPQPQP